MSNSKCLVKVFTPLILVKLPLELATRALLKGTDTQNNASQTDSESKSSTGGQRRDPPLGVTPITKEYAHTTADTRGH